MFGPDHLLDNLSASRERARLSNDMIRFMIIKSLTIRIFWSRVWEPDGNERESGSGI